MFEQVPQDEFRGAWNGRAIVGFTRPYPTDRIGERSRSGFYRYVAPPPDPVAAGS